MFHQSITVKVSTLVDINICKIQKITNFTHFTPKIFYISPSKIVYIYTFATIIVHIYTITVTVHTIILLISQFPTFFLSLLCVQNELNLRLLLSSSSFSSDTHKHIYIDKSTQRYTNTPTRTNQQKERERESGVGRLWIDAGGGDQSLWVNGNRSGCLWIDVGDGDRCWWQRLELGMAMERGGAGRVRRMGSLPSLGMILSYPIPAPPHKTGKIFLPHLHPLGPRENSPYPVKLYFLLICP